MEANFFLSTTRIFCTFSVESLVIVHFMIQKYRTICEIFDL